MQLKRGVKNFAENFTNWFFNHNSLSLSLWTYNKGLPAELFNDIILRVIYVNFRNKRISE